MSVHTESAFESAIEAHLLANGWVQGAASSYRRDVGLDTAMLFEFIEATQIMAWNRLVALHGNADQAQIKFAKRLAAEIDSRGTIDVLRRGVDDLGVKIRLAFFKPAHALTAELGVLYDANRLVVTRQVHHSESNPHDSIDILLLLNGLPISTVEVKNQVTGQSVEHAKAQYRKDRNPKDLLFDKRTVVHFAVDQDLVFLTTRLAGEATVFPAVQPGLRRCRSPRWQGQPANHERVPHRLPVEERLAAGQLAGSVAPVRARGEARRHEQEGGQARQDHLPPVPPVGLGAGPRCPRRDIRAGKELPGAAFCRVWQEQ